MVPLPGHEDAVAGDGMSFEELEHELRTPLASVRSLSEILRDHPDLTEEQRRRFLDGILRENERLTRIVERLLGSTRLREGLS
jgi:signal transduction histidine kinase